MKKILSAIICMPAMLLAQAQVPNLLKDVNPGAGNSTFQYFSAFPNNNIVFSVNTPNSATRGLWASDGSTAGTVQLRLFTNTAASINISNFTDYNNKKYFTANTPGHILWRTDGTAAGTDSLEIPELTGASAMTVYNNLLFFIGTSTLTGSEVWRSDGTLAGTFMVKDILPGGGSSIGPLLKFLGAYNNSMYFIANDNVAGQEIWKSDGTNAGTSLLMDIFPGTASSSPGNFSSGNNGVYFTASTTAAGTELWFSDGTTANTQMVRDVATGTASAIPSRLLFVGNYAYYHYEQAIYKTDGTSAGTTTLAISTPTNNTTFQQEIEDADLKTYNNNIYFLYRARTGNNIVVDSIYFCKTDLNLSSFNIVMKQKFSAFIGASNILDRFLVNNSHFIYSVRGGSGDYVVIFNPANNTSRMYNGDLDYSGSAGLPNEYQVFGNKLYFPFILNANINNAEPSYLDLTNDSIYVIKDINPNGGSTTCQMGSSVNHLYTLNSINYFLAWSPGYGMEFWQTDFTSAGTVMVKDINTGAYDYNYAGSSYPCNTVQGILTPNNFYFVANDPVNGTELWSFINAANPVGIAINSVNNDLRVFPNPASTKITVSSASGIERITLYNTLGALVKDEALQNKTEETLNINDLKAGVYFMSIKTGKDMVTKKIIKSE